MGQGFTISLPCNTGDIVYQIRGKRHAYGKGVSPRIVSCATVWSNGNYTLHHQGQTPCTKSDLGITWFLTDRKYDGKLLKGTLITIELSKKEGWYNKNGSKWQTIPQQMLMYRAATWFARVYCPEILMGFSTEGEVDDVQPEKTVVKLGG